jgi:hypothetical protein
MNFSTLSGVRFYMQFLPYEDAVKFLAQCTNRWKRSAGMTGSSGNIRCAGRRCSTRLYGDTSSAGPRMEPMLRRMCVAFAGENREGHRNTLSLRRIPDC